MLKRPCGSWCLMLTLLILPALAIAQSIQGRRTLIVNGQPGEAPVIQIEGHWYVELESLVRIVNGSLAFRENQITLTLPASASSTTPAGGQLVSAGFSRDFLRAGIEQMAAVREWRIALSNAIQNGYPVSESWIASYRGQASQNLSMASVAATTEADRNAFQLLSNEFNNMKKLTDRFLQASKSMQYVSPDALKNDPLDQKILACAHSLASMAASNQYVDDGSCR